MMTLFMSITGGINWFEAYEPLRQVSLMALWLFNLYVVIGFFTILNMVTGVCLGMRGNEGWETNRGLYLGLFRLGGHLRLSITSQENCHRECFNPRTYAHTIERKGVYTYTPAKFNIIKIENPKICVVC